MRNALPLLLVLGCGAALQSSATKIAPRTLAGTDGASHVVPAADRGALTVLVFFSAECDCQTAHDARLRALAERYRGRPVRFFAVDSELDASVERDATQAQQRAYPYPVLIDRHASLASTLGAEYATYSVVLDARGRVRYRGGIDSDLVHLRDDAVFYLRDALDDLIAGREPRRTTGEALGCALRTE